MTDQPHLIDEVGGETYPIDEARWCSDARTSLAVSDLPGITRDRIDQATRSLWRYRAAFPMELADPVTLGEGCTPLVPRSFRDNQALFKLEWFAPSGSFKDRGASVMLSLLRQQGVQEVAEDSSGNGGAAVAAFGAAADMKVHILAPDSTSPSKIAQIGAYGAEVHLIPGPREATEAAALEMAERVFYASHNWHPFFLQGTKTLGYELWEDLGFRAPDNIIIPTGAGSNVLGCDMAFRELQAAGEIDRLPRLFVAQPANCAPIDAAFRAGADTHVETEFAPTIAEGTAIKRPLRLKGLLAALRRSGGGTVAISEEGIRAAALDLAKGGLFAEPTSATAAAAFDELTTTGRIAPDEVTVVVLTGGGLKAAGFYERALSGND
jgi:threonine synthase